MKEFCCCYSFYLPFIKISNKDCFCCALNMIKLNTRFSSLTIHFTSTLQTQSTERVQHRYETTPDCNTLDVGTVLSVVPVQKNTTVLRN